MNRHRGQVLGCAVVLSAALALPSAYAECGDFEGDTETLVGVAEDGSFVVKMAGSTEACMAWSQYYTLYAADGKTRRMKFALGRGGDCEDPAGKWRLSGSEAALRELVKDKPTEEIFVARLKEKLHLTPALEVKPDKCSGKSLCLTTGGVAQRWKALKARRGKSPFVTEGSEDVTTHEHRKYFRHGKSKLLFLVTELSENQYDCQTFASYAVNWALPEAAAP